MKTKPTKPESCAWSHKCGKCNRLIAQEKRQEERDAEKAARKREKQRKKTGGNWAIYAAIAIALIMAVGVVTKSNEATGNSTTTTQGEMK